MWEVSLLFVKNILVQASCSSFHMIYDEIKILIENIIQVFFFFLINVHLLQKCFK